MHSSKPVSSITLCGVDGRTDIDALRALLRDPCVELGLLLSADPDGRNRYPGYRTLVEIAANFPGRCALHICGLKARKHLLDRDLVVATSLVERIQINGSVSPEEVNWACDIYPLSTIITQYRAGRGMVRVDRPNHALLIDDSNGNGKLPEMWSIPKVECRIGFAGGLGPETLAEQLPRIAATQARNAWVCMESGLRDANDWFDIGRAKEVMAIFHAFRGEQHLVA